MSAVVDQRTGAARPPRLPLVPPGFDWWVFALLAIGLCALYGPAYVDLARTVWATDEQGHGPIILVISFWLMWCRRDGYLALDTQPATAAGSVLLAVGFVQIGRASCRERV